jgi:HK97 family phage portal protein
MAFVLTAGKLASTAPNASTYGPIYGAGQAVRLSPHLALTYAAIWRSQPAVRTVVGFLARNVAQLGIGVFERVSDTDRSKLSGHPLAVLLERPFPGTKWNRYRLINALMHDLCIYDEAYWLKLKTPDSTGRGLWPLRPWQVNAQGPTWGLPTAYKVGSKLEVNPDQMVAFWGYNPDDARNGCSPIETLRQILAEEASATTFREQMWRNGTRASGYIQRPKDAPRWSDDARTRFKAGWQAQYTGDGPQTGGTPILEDGMEFVPAGVTPRDAQYVESRKLTREEVATAYHVPPVLVGLLGEGATFSNVRELHKVLYQDTLPPWLEWITQDIETQLLPDLDPGVATGKVYVEFTLEAKLRGSFEEQAGALMAATGAPWMTRAEARARMNLPELDGADELIVPLNVIAGGLAAPNDTGTLPITEPGAPGGPKGTPTWTRLPALGAPLRALGRAGHPGVPPGVLPGVQGPLAHAVQSFLDRQLSAVASRLGNTQADGPAVFDRDRWNRELAADLLPTMTSLTEGLASQALFDNDGDPDGFEVGPLLPALAAHAAATAAALNTHTAEAVALALATPEPQTALRQLRAQHPARAAATAADLAAWLTHTATEATKE